MTTAIAQLPITSRLQFMDSEILFDEIEFNHHLELLNLEPGKRYWLRAYPTQGISTNVYTYTDKNGKTHTRNVDKPNFEFTYGDINDYALASFIDSAYQDSASIGLVMTTPGKDKEGVTHSLALFTESDSATTNEQLTMVKEKLGLEPTFQVDTGNKSIHSYIVANEPIPFVLSEAMQKDVIITIGLDTADNSLWDAGQVMRLAGFVHPKTGKIARIVDRPAKVYYSVEQLRNVIPVTDHSVFSSKGNSTSSSDEGIYYEGTNTHTILLQAIQEDIFFNTEKSKSYSSYNFYCKAAELVYGFEGCVVACNGLSWRLDEVEPICEERGEIDEWFKCSDPFSPTNSNKNGLTISNKADNLPPGFVSSGSGISGSVLQFAIGLENLKSGKFITDYFSDNRYLIDMAKRLYNYFLGASGELKFAKVLADLDEWREQCKIKSTVQNWSDTSDLPDTVFTRLMNSQKLSTDELAVVRGVYQEQLSNVKNPDQLEIIAEDLSKQLVGSTKLEIATQNTKILTGYSEGEIVLVNDRLLAWNGKYFEAVNEALLMKRVDIILSKCVVSYTNSKGKEVNTKPFISGNDSQDGYRTLRRSLAIDEKSFKQLPGFNLLDGFVQLLPNGRHRLLPHSPEYCCTSIVPCKYPSWNNKDERDHIRKIMKSLFQTILNPVHKDNLILSLAGVLNVDEFFNKFGHFRCILLSDSSGNNGKDTIRKLMQYLIGRDRVGSSTLKHYAEARKGNGFQIGELYNKCLNWGSENMTQNIALATLDDLFADITGDDRKFNPKGIKPFEASFRGLQIQNSNEGIIVTSLKTAFVRRFGIVEYKGMYVNASNYDPTNPLHFLEDTRYKNGDKSFIPDHVLPAFIRVILDYYYLLFSGKKSFDWSYMTELMQEQLKDSRHFARFLDDSCLVYDEKSNTPTEKIYGIYAYWCFNNQLATHIKLVCLNPETNKTEEYQMINGNLDSNFLLGFKKHGLKFIVGGEIRELHRDQNSNDKIVGRPQDFGKRIKQETDSKVTSFRDRKGELGGKKDVYYLMGLKLM